MDTIILTDMVATGFHELILNRRSDRSRMTLAQVQRVGIDHRHIQC